MDFKLIQDFIPAGRINRRDKEKMTPQWITIHNTANDKKGANAQMHALYLKRVEKKVSWHFTVDDKIVVQHLPITEPAYHAGDGSKGPGNATSIGIEVCENSDGDFNKALENARKLVNWLVANNKTLSYDKVVPHQKWSGKYCPRKILGSWNQFVQSLKMAKAGPFPDVPADRWSAKGIEFLKKQGILSGYPDGRFNPTGYMTREEFAHALYLALTSGAKALVDEEPFIYSFDSNIPDEELFALIESAGCFEEEKD